MTDYSKAYNEERLLRIEGGLKMYPPSSEEMFGLIQALRAERERGKELEEELQGLIYDVENGISQRARVRELEGELKALRNELDSHLSEIYSRGSVSDG
jgi:hypothetical protein